MTSPIPETREEAEALVREAETWCGEISIEMGSRENSLALIALARIGLNAAFPDELTIARVAQALSDAGNPDGNAAWYMDDARAALRTLSETAHD